MRCIGCETLFATGQSRAFSNTCATAIQLKLHGVFAPTWLHISKFCCHRWQVTAKVCRAPRLDGPTSQDRSECKVCCLNLLHTLQPVLVSRAFTHRRFYTQTLLHTDAFTHRRFYTQTLLHTDAFTHKHFDTQTLLHTKAFTHKHFYTQTLLHAEAFTRRRFYTQKLLHTNAFTHKRFYTQSLLHTDAFTHRRFYTQAGPCSRSHSEVIVVAATSAIRRRGEVRTMYLVDMHSI